MKYLLAFLVYVAIVSAQYKIYDDCKWPKYRRITSTVLLGSENQQGNKTYVITWSCIGTLINDRFVLTPAICLRDKQITFIKFHDANVVSVLKTIMHPRYSKNRHSNDIGLVELREPVDVTEYIPSCMERVKNLSYDKKWFTNSVNVEHAITKFDTELVSFEDCQTIYHQFIEWNNDSQLCVIEKTTERLQLGAHLFSGEPTLIGIPLFGKNSFEEPQVFTKVAYFVPWIEVVAWGKKITSMVLVGYNLIIDNVISWRCTGSLINDRFILTSANCLNHTIGQDIIIKFYDGHVVNGKKTIMHPKYSLVTSHNDIGLVELSEPIDVTQYIPTFIETDKNLAYDNKWFVNLVNLQHTINKFDTEFVSFDACQNIYSYQELSKDSQLCVIEKTNDIFPYGAHLFSGDNKLVGVLSLGIDVENAPEVYTAVAYFVPWIESVALGKMTSTVLVGDKLFIEININWRCTGTLINAEFILTSANCLKRTIGRDIFIKFNDGHVVNGKQVIKHPEYSADTGSNDIGLVELKEPVDINQYIPTYIETDKDLAYDTKWFINLMNLEHAITKYDAVFVSIEDCQKIYLEFKEWNNDSQLCIIEKTDDIFPFGAHLFSGENKLIGILSHGIDVDKAPEVYTKVAYFVPWIKSVALV